MLLKKTLDSIFVSTEKQLAKKNKKICKDVVNRLKEKGFKIYAGREAEEYEFRYWCGLYKDEPDIESRINMGVRSDHRSRTYPTARTSDKLKPILYFPASTRGIEANITNMIIRQLYKNKINIYCQEYGLNADFILELNNISDFENNFQGLYELAKAYEKLRCGEEFLEMNKKICALENQFCQYVEKKIKEKIEVITK